MTTTTATSIVATKMIMGAAAAAAAIKAAVLRRREHRGKHTNTKRVVCLQFNTLSLSHLGTYPRRHTYDYYRACTYPIISPLTQLLLSMFTHLFMFLRILSQVHGDRGHQSAVCSGARAEATGEARPRDRSGSAG